MRLNKLLILFICLLQTVVMKAQETNPYIKAKSKTTAFEKKMELYVNQLIVTGKYKEAIQHIETNLSVLRLTSDELYLAYGLFGMGKLYTLINHFRKAEEALLECKAIREKRLGTLHSDYFAAALVLAELYIEMDRFDEAETLIEATKDNDISDIPVYRILQLDFIGILYAKTDRWELAEQAFLQSQALKQKAYGRLHPAYVDALVKLAKLYIASGRLSEAENMLLEAIRTARNLKKKEDLDIQDVLIFNIGFLEDDLREALFSLAEIYLNKNEHHKAEMVYKQAMQSVLATFGKEHTLYANILSALGHLYAEDGQVEKALSMQLEAYEIIKKIVDESNSSYLLILKKLAFVYGLSGNIEEAKNTYRHYLKAIETHYSAFPGKYATALNELGNFYCKTGVLNEGIDFYKKSLAVNSNTVFGNRRIDDYLEKPETFNFFSEASALESFQLLFDAYDRRAIETKDKALGTKAYQVLKAIMKLNERVRNQFAEDANKMALLSANAFYAQKGIEWALRLGGNQQKELAGEAFAFAEQNKSILLSNALKADKARNMSDLPEEMALQEVKLQRQLSQIKKQLLESDNADIQAIFRQELIDLEIEINRFKKEIETKYPKYFNQKYAASNSSVSDVQALLGNESLFLEYFVCDSLIYVFSIDKENIRIKTLRIDKKTLHAQTKKLRTALSDYNLLKNDFGKSVDMYCDAAAWFYKSILKPALDGAEGKNHLIIVADDALGHLPFEAFLTKETTTKTPFAQMPYVLVDYKVSYSYGAGLWLENMQAKSKTKKGKMLAAAASYKETQNVGENQSKQLQEIRKNLSDLPAVREEVNVLSQNFEGSFLQDTATNEKAFKENAADYSLVHLAMHGILNTREPVLSSLAFTENADTTEDNFLQAYEIAHLHLNADLVVLSACETGFGKFQQGEGVMSLARSFMYAGVPSLVVSMWQVNDQSTSVIMQSFYKNLAKGMDKAEALRQAKLSYVKTIHESSPQGSIAAHPAFWAPFIQIGNHEAVKLQRKGEIGLWVYIVAGISVLGLLGFGVYKMRKKG